MNHFPKFDPNKEAHLQLGSVNLNTISLGQKSNQIQPGVGYRVTQTPGGTTTSVIKRRYPLADLYQFKVTVSKDEDVFKASVKPGWLQSAYHNAGDDPVPEFWMPETLDNDPPPKFTVSDGDVIAIKCLTNAALAPTAVTIEVIPKEDAVSSAGLYYYIFAEFEADGEFLKIIQYQQGGPILHRAGGNRNQYMRIFDVYTPGPGEEPILTVTDSGTTSCWRNGLYVGIFTAGDEPEYTGTLDEVYEDVANHVD